MNYLEFFSIIWQMITNMMVWILFAIVMSSKERLSHQERDIKRLDHNDDFNYRMHRINLINSKRKKKSK